MSILIDRIGFGVKHQALLVLLSNGEKRKI